MSERCDLEESVTPPTVEELLGRITLQQQREQAALDQLDELWGEPPRHRDTPEDGANLFQQLYYGWATDYILKASREELTIASLPPPQREMSTYVTGRRLSSIVVKDFVALRAWKPYIGVALRYRGEPWTRGWLRWVGFLQQSDSPGSVMAGVEWDIPPSHRMILKNAAPEKRVFHDGVVDGERLFCPTKPGCSTCELASMIVLLPATGGASETENWGKDIPDSVLLKQAPPHPRQPQLLWELFRAHSSHMLYQIPWKLLSDVSMVLSTVFLEWFVRFLRDDDAGAAHGLLIVLGIFIVNSVQSCAAHKFDHISIRAAAVFEESTTAVVVEKCLRISRKAMLNPEMSTGRIMNMASTDVSNVGDLNWYVIYFLSAPIVLLLALSLLFRLVGWSALASIVVLLASFPAQGLLADYEQRLEEQRAKASDKRISATNELFSGIRIVKFMGWEPKFLAVVESRRERELSLIRRIQYCRTVFSLINGATPILVVAAVFILFHVTGGIMTPLIVFPTLSLLNIMRTPFFMIPVIITAIVVFLVSARRIIKFLECDDANTSAEDIQGIFKDAEALQRWGAALRDIAAEFHEVSISTHTPHKLPGRKKASSASLAAMLWRWLTRSNAPLDVRDPSCDTIASPEATPSTASPTGSPTSASAGPLTEEAPDDTDESAFFQLRPKLLMEGVSITFPKGKLTMVVGATGSGKSTLLHALLGELEVSKGRVWATSSIAYVPQQAWIMNATLRDNVLFFSDADEARFERVLDVCQLRPDLELLANGVQTEIGEKGINLSGGQKARVSLARAVYADRELYLLDDPLSALDAHVGSRIVSDVVMGELREKTRVLVTHQVSYLHMADQVIVVRRGGVAFCGSHEEYLKSEVSLEIAATLAKEEEEVVAPAQDGSSTTEGPGEETKWKTLDGAGVAPGRTSEEVGGVVHADLTSGAPACAAAGDGVAGGDTEGKLMTTEEIAIGRVPWATYKKYIMAAGGLRTLLVLIAVYSVTEVVNLMTNVWLSMWATGTGGFSGTQFLYGYLVIVALGVLSAPLRYLVCCEASRAGARSLHAALLRTVAIGTMQFFDTTPLGRVLNRFTRDIGTLDDGLGGDYNFLLECLFSILSAFGIMSVTQPLVIFAIIPSGFVYYRLMDFYNSANRSIRRISSVVQSPVFTLLSETLSGRGTITAYRKSHVVLAEAISRLDTVFSAKYIQNVVNRWLGVRIELISCFIISVVALLGVLSKLFQFSFFNVGLISLSLTMSMTLTELLNWLVRQTASVEANMNSVERIQYYMEHVQTEQLEGLNDLIKKVKDDDDEDFAHPRSDGSIPTRPALVTIEGGDGGGRGGATAATGLAREVVAGSLEFRGVDMRYRDGLPLVLRGVSFQIAPRQKVGVVGRTGSGKSTLLLTFMRLVDICGGEILVSGRAIRSYGLRELRQLFSMIPQDPVLFDGTVRSNLDPFLEASAEEVWGALELVGMRERVAAESGGIDSRVLEGGSNFSVGQRQLLCLARALLKRGSGFILMDEATANIDQALDKQIQRTVMTAFAAYTVITIAHRLHTVANYDTIIVMDHGCVAEIGSPRELALSPTSVFRSMVESMGKGEAERFVALLEAS